VDYGRLTGVLIEAVKELRAEKDAEIAALKQQNANLEERVAALEALLTSLAQGQTE
jgi:cell division protein FtsB